MQLCAYNLNNCDECDKCGNMKGDKRFLTYLKAFISNLNSWANTLLGETERYSFKFKYGQQATPIQLTYHCIGQLILHDQGMCRK